MLETIKEIDVEFDVWNLFLLSMKSPVTKQKYQKRLSVFLDFISVNGQSVKEKSLNFIQISKNKGNQWAFNSILQFIQFQLERVNNKEITGSTLQNYIKPIKLLCDIADISIPWKKITRGLPRGKSYASDRIPTLEEIQTILNYPDRRIKSIVYTMTSSGIRLGAWKYLKWNHIIPIEKDGQVVAAKIIVYAGEDEEYYSFISRIAYTELKNWMDYREKCGELINGNSWLMRDLWDTQINTGTGFVTRPKQLAPNGIKRLIERALWAQGLRKKLENGQKRHPFQAIHSFRKWFKTRCEIAGMKPINVEKLLSHSIGISNSYYRPTENELLDDYLKIVDFLSIDKETQLQHQLVQYKEKNNQENMIIKAKLQEKEEQIDLLNKKYERSIQTLKEEMENRFQQIFAKINISELN